MSAPLIFLDTETTGLALNDDIWEFAAIRREPDGTQDELHLFIQHSTEKCNKLPEPFLTDHQARFPASHTTSWHEDALEEEDAVAAIAAFLEPKDGQKAHIVGAVPNFDTERLARLFDRYGLTPQWHYHLIDVENLAVGYLRGLALIGSDFALPWDSDVVSAAAGVEPPGEGERHTAMGDARWAMAIYDRVMGGAS